MAIGPSARSADDDAAGVRAERSTQLIGQGTDTMKIRLTIGGAVVTATVIDNTAARDFLALLPMALTLEDYAAFEKISYLPKKLSVAGVPAGFDPSVGDLTYYAPWGNLAIFYKDSGYAQGLVPLGKIDTGMSALAAPGMLKVTIEPIEK
jgi:hypothetical protein